MEKYKICAVTGHRPNGFPWDYSNKSCSEHKDYLATMERAIVDLIDKEKYNYFISGGAIGVDTDFAEIVIRLRDTKFPNIRLEIAVPCENQDLKWFPEDKRKYRKILEKADFVNVLSPVYTRSCMQERNEYMADKADIVLVFWNVEVKKGGTHNTIKYLDRKKIDYKLYCLQGFLEKNKKIEAQLRNLAQAIKATSVPSWEQFKQRMIDKGLWPVNKTSKDS